MFEINQLNRQTTINYCLPCIKYVCFGLRHQLIVVMGSYFLLFVGVVTAKNSCESRDSIWLRARESSAGDGAFGAKKNMGVEKLKTTRNQL